MLASLGGLSYKVNQLSERVTVLEQKNEQVERALTVYGQALNYLLDLHGPKPSGPGTPRQGTHYY